MKSWLVNDGIPLFQGLLYIPYHPCLIHLPTCTTKINHSYIHVGKYTNPMDGMGIHIWLFPKNMDTPKWMVYTGKPY